MVRGPRQVFAKARRGSSLVCHRMTSQSGCKDTLSLVWTGCVWGVTEPTSESCHGPSPPSATPSRRKPSMCQGVWALPFTSRNSYHVDISKGMHHIAVESAAGTTKWWMWRLVRKGYAHTLTSSLNALNQFTHTKTNTHTSFLNPAAAIWVEKSMSCRAPQSHSPGPWS